MSKTLSAKAKLVLQRAEEKAQRLAHSELQIEQIIEAILMDDTSLASKALRLSGVTIASVSDETIAVQELEVGAKLVSSLLLETLMQLSWHECIIFQQKYIGPEHLLLAVANSEGGRQWMSSRGISCNLLRSNVLKLMGVS